MEVISIVVSVGAKNELYKQWKYECIRLMTDREWIGTTKESAFVTNYEIIDIYWIAITLELNLIAIVAETHYELLFSL